jgi:hypothetical protein
MDRPITLFNFKRLGGRMNALRQVSPETAVFDQTAAPCLCGALPLLVEAHGQFYMNCPPCYVITHRVESAEVARKQWASLLAVLA